MDFKPNEFYLNLVEFITVLLPGAVMATILLSWEATGCPKGLYQYAFETDKSIAFWIAFVFASFGLGYFLSSVASGLDHVYDEVRKQVYPYEEDLAKRFGKTSDKKRSAFAAMYEKQREEMQKKGGLPEENPPLPKDHTQWEGFKIAYLGSGFRKALLFFFELDTHVKIEMSYTEVRKIMASQPKAVQNASNAFKWAIIILESQYPAIGEQVIRLMAASKFFRSLVVVSLLFLLLQVTHQIQTTYWQHNLVLLVLSFREYVVHRQKSIQKAYQSLVTLLLYRKEVTL